MFSHDVSGGLFQSYHEVGTKNDDNPEALLFSNLNKLENFRNEGKFQFKLCYPDIIFGRNRESCNEWIQTSNPYTESTITGFQEISLAFDKNSNNQKWSGLGRNTAGNDIFTIIDDAPTSRYWHSAVGAKKYVTNAEGKIPGPRGPPERGRAMPWH